MVKIMIDTSKKGQQPLDSSFERLLNQLTIRLGSIVIVGLILVAILMKLT